jgi:hypothetical protein
MLLIQDVCDVLDGLVGIKEAMGFHVPCHACSYMRQRGPRVCEVGVVIDDRGGVDGAVGAERPETFVPVDVSERGNKVNGRRKAWRRVYS